MVFLAAGLLQKDHHHHHHLMGVQERGIVRHPFSFEVSSSQEHAVDDRPEVGACHGDAARLITGCCMNVVCCPARRTS